jgi:hypothetical protein
MVIHFGKLVHQAIWLSPDFNKYITLKQDISTDFTISLMR